MLPCYEESLQIGYSSIFCPPSFKQYGRNALEIVMKSIVNLDSPLVSPPADYPGEFFKGI